MSDRTSAAASLDLAVGPPPIVSIHDDRLVTLDVLRRCFQPGGRPIDRASIYRWVSTGVRGLKLPAIRIGGRWFSTVAALRWFVDARTCHVPARPARRPTRSRQNVQKAARGVDHDRALLELRAFGFLTESE